MFKITTSDTFKWPVEVRIPIDGGRYHRATFDAEFRRLPQSQLDELSDRILQSDKEGLDACKRIVVGWDGVQDDSGDVPFSEDALARVIDIPGVAAALIRSYFEAGRGLERKN